MRHPASVDLEAFACGDAVAHVARHVATCAACLAYVERARALPAPLPLPLSIPRAVATRAPDAPGPATWARRFAYAAPALAAAAALVLHLRTVPHAGPEHAAPTAPTAQVTAPASGGGVPSGTGGTAFKGAAQLAVVRERAGVQERFTSGVRVRAGDRIRLEVSLDHTEAVMAGVLADDGTFVAVMPEAARSAGTHYADRALRVDDRSSSGYAVVGSQADVDAARARGDRRRVASMRIEWEAE